MKNINIKKIALLICLTVLLIFNISCTLIRGYNVCTTDLKTASKPPRDKYQLVWHDEFDGNELDFNKWKYRDLGPRRLAINVEDAVSLDGRGHLVITTTKHGNEYHTGMIGTGETYTALYGYFECRVKLQKEIGHWSAFWLQSPNPGKYPKDCAKSGTEMDVFEYLRRKGDRVQHAVHYYGCANNVLNHVLTVVEHPRLSEGWHTFGLLWTEDEYVFYIDDIETWRITDNISQIPQYMILSLEVGSWAGDITKSILPDSFYVDYVRVYQEKRPNK